MLEAAKYQTIGKSVPKPDARLKATGAALYAGDIRLPGMLDAKVLRSPHPHARILARDIAAAVALPGVKAVITGDDVPDERIGGGIHDQHALAKDKVIYAGEPVAAVAAVDEETAERALALIRIDYEQLPAVFDGAAALAADAPVVHPDLGTYHGVGPTFGGSNVRTRLVHEAGDVDSAWGEPDLVVHEATYVTPRQSPGATEPHAAVAQVDSTGKVTVWASNKAPFRTRMSVASTLGIPLSRVRFISPLVGGDFGGKGGGFVEPIVALLAWKARQPVRLALSRMEELTAMTTRPQYTIQLKLGARRDGTIIALEATQICNLGAIDDFGPNRAERNAALTGGYRIPHVRVTALATYTNTMPSGHVRAPAGPQNAFALESAVDSMARKLGMDPFALRTKNIMHNGDLVPVRGSVLQNSGLEECIARAEGWVGREAGSRPGPRGVGIAIGAWSLGPKFATAESAASVRVEVDGSVVVFTGTPDQGGGQWSVLAQIASEVLTVPLDRISVVAADTETSPYETGVGGSNITYRAGTSVRQAAQDAKEQLLRLAAERLKVDEEDLELRGDEVQIGGKGLSIRELAEHALGSSSGPIFGTSAVVREREVEDHGREQGEIADSPSFSCHVAEVEVDVHTGVVRVPRYFAAQDVGRALNPMNCEGQLQGGVTFGLGYALSEEIVNQDGINVNANLWEYLLPTAPGMPELIVDLVEIPSTYGPFGAKGIGEGPCIPVAAAIANAVEDAIGVRVTEIPLTPERVLAAIRAQRPELQAE